MRVTSFQRTLVTLRHFLPAKFTIFSGSTMNRCPSPWAQETRSKPKLARQDQKNMLRPLFVSCSIPIPWHSLNFAFSLAKAIDRYIELRTDELSGAKKDKIDPRLQLIIEGIFARCIEEGEYKQVRLSSKVSFPMLTLNTFRQSELLLSRNVWISSRISMNERPTLPC